MSGRKATAYSSSSVSAVSSNTLLILSGTVMFHLTLALTNSPSRSTDASTRRQLRSAVGVRTVGGVGNGGAAVDVGVRDTRGSARRPAGLGGLPVLVLA